MATLRKSRRELDERQHRWTIAGELARIVSAIVVSVAAVLKLH